MNCIPCPKPGTVPVHHVSAGNMVGTNSGPSGGDILACEEHAAEIAREPDAPAWLATQYGVGQ